ALHRLQRRAAADDAEMNVGALHRKYDVPDCADQVIDALLPAHHADVADQILASTLELLVGWLELHALEARAAAHDVDALGCHPTALDGDAPIRVVGCDRQVARTKRPVLELAQHAIQTTAPAEFRFEQLGAEVVMIEHELLAEQLEEAADQEEQVGRI